MAQAGNLVNDVWVDSLKYRENFDFLALNLTPKAKLSYSPGKFNLSLQLTPDFYVSKLDSDRNIGNFNSGRVYILPDFNASWTPSPMHKVGITYKQGLTRPSYLQICWFQRAGSYANEIQMGNPKLKPGSNGIANLYYTFHSGFFTGTLEGTTTMNWDKIEKVFNTRGEYHIYTWINSGHSIENRIKLTMQANLKRFNAELGGYYNYFLGYNNAGTETRSSDWGVNGAATLTLKGGWVFDVKGRYQSKIIRTYSSMTEYVGCDVRITKGFRSIIQILRIGKLLRVDATLRLLRTAYEAHFVPVIHCLSVQIEDTFIRRDLKFTVLQSRNRLFNEPDSFLNNEIVAVEMAAI